MNEEQRWKEYSEHWPWYAKVSRGHNWQRIWCKLGKHIPVKCMHTEDIYEVFCQECMEELTSDDWDKFWKG